MPRMQDTAEEPSPSPSTQAGGYGTAGLGAEAAWPKPSPVPASHPTTVTGMVLFLFLFLCLSHQLGTFRSCPVSISAAWSSSGVQSCVPLQKCVPCNAVTLQQHVPEKTMPPPLQQCPLPVRCPPAETHPLSPSLFTPSPVGKPHRDGCELEGGLRGRWQQPRAPAGTAGRASARGHSPAP